MDTIIYHIDEESINNDIIDKAAEVIRQGGTVVFPTETVYGLGANALSSQAASKIYGAKERPADNPLLIHVSCLDMLLYVIGESLSDTAKLLMDKYWPGPLTLIFKKSRHIPNEVSAGLDTVAVRMPDNKIALKLIERSGLPIAAPSANRSGKPSPTHPDHVISDMNGRVDMILCGSSSRIGLESTILDITGEIPVILRPGGITYEELTELLGKVNVDKGLLDKDTAPKAPGMKYTHYAPDADMIIIKGDIQKVTSKIQQLVAEHSSKGMSVGVLACDETKAFYTKATVISMGSRQNKQEIASQIFSALREFDKRRVDIIFAEALDEKNIGLAVMNRMKKAAGFNIIEV